MLTVDLMFGVGVGYLIGWFIQPQPRLLSALYMKLVNFVDKPATDIVTPIVKS